MMGVGYLQTRLGLRWSATSSESTRVVLVTVAFHAIEVVEFCVV